MPRPRFLYLTYELVSQPESDDVISWSANGLSFKVHDPERLASCYMTRYFKHSSYCSFVRALNSYGFKKVRREVWWHPLFHRGASPETLATLRRRRPPKNPLEPSEQALEPPHTGCEEVGTPWPTVAVSSTAPVSLAASSGPAPLMPHSQPLCLPLMSMAPPIASPLIPHSQPPLCLPTPPTPPADLASATCGQADKVQAMTAELASLADGNAALIKAMAALQSEIAHAREELSQCREGTAKVFQLIGAHAQRTGVRKHPAIKLEPPPEPAAPPPSKRPKTDYYESPPSPPDLCYSNQYVSSPEASCFGSLPGSPEQSAQDSPEPPEGCSLPSSPEGAIPNPLGTPAGRSGSRHHGSYRSPTHLCPTSATNSPTGCPPAANSCLPHATLGDSSSPPGRPRPSLPLPLCGSSTAFDLQCSGTAAQIAAVHSGLQQTPQLHAPATGTPLQHLVRAHAPQAPQAHPAPPVSMSMAPAGHCAPVQSASAPPENSPEMPTQEAALQDAMRALMELLEPESTPVI